MAGNWQGFCASAMETDYSTLQECFFFINFFGKACNHIICCVRRLDAEQRYFVIILKCFSNLVVTCFFCLA